MTDDASFGSERQFVRATTEARKAQRISQADVAQRMVEAGHGWHQTTVTKVEAGERRLLLSEAFALARVLGVDLSGAQTPAGAVRVELLSAADEFCRRMRSL